MGKNALVQSSCRTESWMIALQQFGCRGGPVHVWQHVQTWACYHSMSRWRRIRYSHPSSLVSNMWAVEPRTAFCPPSGGNGSYYTYLLGDALVLEPRGSDRMARGASRQTLGRSSM
nr:hypothetical protein CFP56_32298 [Quercus suber]